MIDLDRMAAAQFEAWEVLLTLAVRPEPWVLIGGQMMAVLAAEHGRQLPRTTPDIDVLVDVRASPGAIHGLCSWLVDEHALELGSVSAGGTGGRFERRALTGAGTLMFDVLAPEGLGRKTNLRTRGNARTVQVPGSGNLLASRELVDVRFADVVGDVRRTGHVWRPSLTAALIGKAAATEIPARQNPERDWEDCALLLALLPKVPEATTLGPADRRRLRNLDALTNESHPAWRPFSPGDRRQGSTMAGLIVDSVARA